MKMVPGRAQERNNDMRKEPYDVPTTTEPQRRRPNKDSKSLKRRIQKNKQPLQMLKRTEPSRTAQWTRLIKHQKQMKEPN